MKYYTYFSKLLDVEKLLGSVCSIENYGKVIFSDIRLCCNRVEFIFTDSDKNEISLSPVTAFSIIKINGHNFGLECERD